jgi:hypothetical protein
VSVDPAVLAWVELLVVGSLWEMPWQWESRSGSSSSILWQLPSPLEMLWQWPLPLQSQSGLRLL